MVLGIVFVLFIGLVISIVGWFDASNNYKKASQKNKELTDELDLLKKKYNI